jgi:uncharacterized protein (DUF58 family)
MPTTRGWAALGVGLALPILWIAFGELVMLAVGTFLIIAVGIGIVSVRAATPRIAISRSIAPVQVHDGDRAVVVIDLVASRTIHSATVIDKVHGLGTARFTAHRLQADDPVEARYEVLCHPRGVYRIGPATVIVEDPFGLAESLSAASRVDRLVVFPAVEDLIGLPTGRGLDPTADTTRASFSQAGGEDFFTLREYQVGDDLRRVHWPTSAKRDELMIRQLEAHWQSRALVLLDPRSAVYPDDATFEHAVSGLASAVRHLYRSGYRPTVWTGGVSYIPVDSADGYQRAMEELAVVRARGPVDLVRVFSQQRGRDGTGGVLLMMTGAPDDGAIQAFRSLDRDFDHKIIMSAARSASSALGGFGRSGVSTVVARPGERWAGAWKEGMERSWSTATAG